MEPDDGSRLNRVAVAIYHSDPPQVFLAESDETLSRLIALRVVAQASPAELSYDYLIDIREALLAEEWGRAVTLWLTSTDEVLDAYGSEPVVLDQSLDDERVSMEIRLAPIFDDVEGRSE